MNTIKTAAEIRNDVVLLLDPPYIPLFEAEQIASGCIG